MTSPDSSELAQDRTDAATCREAAILLRGRPTDGLDLRARDPCPEATPQRGEPRARGGRPLSATKQCDVRRCTSLINFSACG
jgi:hypothetical protein